MRPQPKPKTVKDDAWLKVVRTMPCHMCGQRSPDTIGNGLSEASHLNTKSRDDRVLPMDGSCHRTGRVAWHRGEDTFCVYWNTTKEKLIAEAEALYAAYKS